MPTHGKKVRKQFLLDPDKLRLMNDALIALTARDSKIVVLTANLRNFDLLREFFPFVYRPFDLTVT